MTLDQETEYPMDRYLGCFGNYRRNDPICRKRCALTLRCIIEQDQNERFEILEELVSANGMEIKVN
ncbi:hypothetical protein [Desulfosarcina ovata]|uniref:Uncharacterized protein n=2 Tax=Desulfosarcina ovata TaxID=83564 RepID=A0A5K8A2T5_9BACT|nr:hypothetical protein [Desulfosarcina ovata]BBO79436.1 hypothetical protein DSCO28_00020 [Desulfosarcina ovata subsp. sediminis]BBO86822.1 hypothetical protein DSCOOX_00020 [Desulfosarcina ovata subsp. ovata]